MVPREVCPSGKRTGRRSASAWRPRVLAVTTCGSRERRSGENLSTQWLLESSPSLMFSDSRPSSRTCRKAGWSRSTESCKRAARLQTTRPIFPKDQRRFDADAYYEDHEIARQRVVNVVMASDSIAVYSAGDGYADALAVGAAVRGLLLAGFRSRVPLRGALAIGDSMRLISRTTRSTGRTGRRALLG